MSKYGLWFSNFSTFTLAGLIPMLRLVLVNYLMVPSTIKLITFIFFYRYVHVCINIYYAQSQTDKSMAFDKFYRFSLNVSG